MLQTFANGWREDGQTFAHGLGAAGKVDNERAPAQSRDGAGKNYGPGETTIRKNACVLPDKL